MSKGSFFDRLTGNMPDNNEELEIVKDKKTKDDKQKKDWIDEEGVGQLTVDMYQTSGEIIIHAMLAGVGEDDLDVSIAQDMITIKGKRKSTKEVSEENYFYKELYWGSFSRSILLPQEIDPENAEASLKKGLLVIRLPKVDKDKTQKLKVNVG